VPPPNLPGGKPGGAPPPPLGGLPSRPLGPPTGGAPAAPPKPGGLGAPPGGLPSGFPGGVPAAPKKPSGAPPPPAALPVAIKGRAGPSEAGFSAPPPPLGLPGGYPGSPSKPTSSSAAPPPPRPPAPQPTSAAPADRLGKVGAEEAISEASTADQFVEEVEEDETLQDNSWKQYLQANSSDGEDDEDSGEDSDEGASVSRDRHKEDMMMLTRQHNVTKKKVEEKEKEKTTSRSVALEPEAESPSKATEPTAKDSDDDEETASIGTSSKKKTGLMSRLFGRKGGADSFAGFAGAEASMLHDDISQYDEQWYQKQLARLGRDGMPCIKVATNGKPYDRRMHIDARNLQIEIRGGRMGATGIMLDDLDDVRRGMASPEFEQFAARIKKGTDTLKDLSDRALVLTTPNRTYSFVMPSATHRGTVAHCVLFLLKSKNRGVMASGASRAESTKAPKDGHGQVTYMNGSKYEGQFHNHLRHGKGTLTLSDGTRHESEWRNDERHGTGKEFCPDGTTFTGTYLKGMRHGAGIMTWPEGSRYSGQFERGRANGEGELLRTDGSVYRGQFAEDCMSGQGCMQWRDGVEYVGQFAGNRREGFGKMCWSSGRWKAYEGYWKDGVQHGEGTLMDHNNQEFRGMFRAGKLERWLED